MKKFVICLGLGENQLNLIKNIDKNYSIIGIDVKCSEIAKKNINSFYKGSLYKLDNIKKIANQIKSKNYYISFILYRSSGPSILAANYLETFFNIKRINKSLSQSIYSKSYFYKYLKSKKLSGLKSISLNRFNKNQKLKDLVIKPDAPIYGKKNVYLLDQKKDIFYFRKCKKESHNDDVNLSIFCEGDDISSFYLVNNNLNIIKLISHTQEFNLFNKNIIQSVGVCSPPIYKNIRILKKKEILDKLIVKTFKDFYGIISISSKITIKDMILPYEINIGLSGDKFADHIFPHNFKNRSLYEIELNMCLYKKITNLTHNNKFIGFLNNKKITSSDNFLKNIYKYI